MAKATATAVKNSPHFDEIMVFFNNNYKGLKVADLVHGIMDIDSQLPKSKVRNFINDLNKKRKEKVEALIVSHTEEHALDDALDTTKLFRKIRDRAHEMGDTVMEDTAAEMMKYKSKGKPIPDFKKKMIMSWFFKFKEVEQKDRQIDVMNKHGEQEERLVDGLLSSLIYSRNLQPEDIIEGDYEDMGHSDSIQITTGNTEGAS